MYPELTINRKDGNHVEYMTYEAYKAIGFIPIDVMLERLRYDHPNAKTKEPIVTAYPQAHVVKVTIPWYEVIYEELT